KTLPKRSELVNARCASNTLAADLIDYAAGPTKFMIRHAPPRVSSFTFIHLLSLMEQSQRLYNANKGRHLELSLPTDELVELTLSRLKTDLDEYRQENLDLTRALATAEQQMKKANRDLAVKDSRITALEKKIVELEPLITENARLKVQVQQDAADIKSLHTMLGEYVFQAVREQVQSNEPAFVNTAIVDQTIEPACKEDPDAAVLKRKRSHSGISRSSARDHTSMAEATPAQIEANPTEASPSAKETTPESHSSKVNEQPLTPTIKDKPSLEHVAQKDETELRASVMDEGKRIQAELAQMQRETANLKKTLNKKTRVLKEAHALLGETAHYEEQQKALQEQAMLKSIQKTASVKIQEPSSKRPRSSSEDLDAYLQNYQAARAASASSTQAVPANSSGASASAQAPSDQQPSSGKGKGKAPPSLENSAGMQALKDFFANRHLLSGDERLLMLANVVRTCKEEGLEIDPSAIAEMQ
ncbi:hypothetical protein CVT26_009446, partial [Gymnopilus dilepis]